MSNPPRSNPFFPLVVVVGGVFAVTAMSMLAATMGDSRSPPSRFFDAYGIPLILIETLLLVGVSFVAMAVDRRQTLARSREIQSRDSTGDQSSVGEGKPSS